MKKAYYMPKGCRMMSLGHFIVLLIPPLSPIVVVLMAMVDVGEQVFNLKKIVSDMKKTIRKINKLYAQETSYVCTMFLERFVVPLVPPLLVVDVGE